jgi:hypothetical protein
MFGKNEHIGISLEGDVLRIARIRAGKKKLEIIRLDKITLVQKLAENTPKEEKVFDSFEEDLDADSIFGLDDDLTDDEEEELTEIDLSSLDDDDDEDDDMANVDLVSETEQPKTNELQLYSYLSDLSRKRQYVGLNIPAGGTIFQIVRDSDYNTFKKKELKSIVEEKLEAIYGYPPAPDYYSKFVREDGSMIIASIDNEPSTLTLANSVADLMKGGLYINDLVPDEVALIGLYKTHYEIEADQITGLLQLSPNKCRILFMRGENIMQVSPIINEGTATKGFLNTIFSKILFQLDTGEVPGIDRLIIANNTVGDESIDFFQKNFPDLVVEEFQFNRSKLVYDDKLGDIIKGFTTAIGIAAVSAGFEKESTPQISFLPSYVDDRQKIFKLQWHGFILLVLIGVSPAILNHFYQKNVEQINLLTAENSRYDTMIAQVDPLVAEANNLTAQLTQFQSQLTLLQELSKESIRWTITLEEFNKAVEEVGDLWINSFRITNAGILIDGFALNEQRIPQLANRFANVTLTSVRKDEVRNRDIYLFSMTIRQIVRDPAVFTPESSQRIQEILNP